MRGERHRGWAGRGGAVTGAGRERGGEGWGGAGYASHARTERGRGLAWRWRRGGWSWPTVSAALCLARSASPFSAARSARRSARPPDPTSVLLGCPPGEDPSATARAMRPVIPAWSSTSALFCLQPRAHRVRPDAVP